MKILKSFKEFTFLKDLTEWASHKFSEYNVRKEDIIGGKQVDLVIESDEKKVLVEVKYAKNYKALPYSTLAELKELKESAGNGQILLISFSDIKEPMRKKLDRLNIKTLIKPSIETAKNEISKLIDDSSNPSGNFKGVEQPVT